MCTGSVPSAAWACRAKKVAVTGYETLLESENN